MRAVLLQAWFGQNHHGRVRRNTVLQEHWVLTLQEHSLLLALKTDVPALKRLAILPKTKNGAARSECRARRWMLVFMYVQRWVIDRSGSVTQLTSNLVGTTNSSEWGAYACTSLAIFNSLQHICVYRDTENIFFGGFFFLATQPVLKKAFFKKSFCGLLQDPLPG